MSISRPLIAALLTVALPWLGATPLEPPGQVASARRAADPRPATPQLGCRACLLVSDDGEVLFRRRPHAELPNASTTKMMTALLVARAEVLDEETRISEGAANAGGGGFDLEAGEVWPVESLVYALLLSSSNDAAVALAEHVSGSEHAFVDAMNDEARALDLRHTAFVTSHGLDTPGHFSSARDLAVLAGRLLADPPLRRIVGEPKARVEGPQGPVSIENRNLLLETYPGAVGVKTGYTIAAGNVLVSAAVRGGRTLTGVVLGSEDSFADSRALLDYGFARLGRTVLVRRGEEVGAVVLDPAGSARAVAARSVRGLAPPGEVELRFEPSSSFAVPLEAGAAVGRVVVVHRDRIVARTRAVAPEDLPSRGSSWAAEGLATVLSWGQWMVNLTG
ncbi:MAG: D-alanyl-D-alanine carboxypeptidase family protein [Actinomycetota bacterium]